MKLKVLTILAASLLLSSCAKWWRPDHWNKDFMFDMTAVPNLNLNETGRPSPVSLMVYFLNDKQAFIQSDFQSEYVNPKQTLGKALIDVKPFYIAPGQTKTELITVNTKNTRYLGFISAYQTLVKPNRFILKVPSCQLRLKAQFSATHVIIKEGECLY